MPSLLQVLHTVSPAQAYVLLACIVLVSIIYYKSRPPRSRLPLPPGPKPLPLIGNMLDIPKTMSSAEYYALSRKYGDIVYLNAMGNSMILLGSMEAANELLEKRATNYSNKPGSAMANLSFWMERRELHRFTGQPAAIAQHGRVLEKHAATYLVSLLKNPGRYSEDAHLTLGKVIMELSYGIKVKTYDDDYLKLVQEGNDIFQKAFVPGKYLVETFPVLKHIPAWFPGATFRREAAGWRATYGAVRERPFAAAMEHMVSIIPTLRSPAHRGDEAAAASVAGVMVRSAQDENGRISPDDEVLAQNVASTVYTLTTIRMFFLAMATYPAVQKRAQEELDAVMGPDRLPTLADRAALPYVDAVLKECLRWHPILPLALPRTSAEDDEYRGYHIPAGTTVLAHSWCYYPDPERFSPERYFTADGKPNKNVMDPRTFAFGYGRRICPGRNLGEAAVFVTIASVLHAFNVEPPLDESGRPVVPKPKFAANFLSDPEPFDCRITVRSATMGRLVQTAARNMRPEVDSREHCFYTAMMGTVIPA
ncbi:CyP450 monooxygenase [Epithele typhae]|uniref:CyP450 monooxygenase n=1 Tax=Epithele typhae TaxID=378194 RepID=UPI0020080448|nr:CyP450 monooxygenase [Epithele typhae]KAH9937830.1 CyP450 monooxygenase [Epithele typhae]